MTANVRGLTRLRIEVKLVGWARNQLDNELSVALRVYDGDEVEGNMGITEMCKFV